MLALAEPAPVVPWECIVDDMIELALFLDFSGRISEAHGTSGRSHRHQVVNRLVFDFVPADSHEPLRQAMQVGTGHRTYNHPGDAICAPLRRIILADHADRPGASIWPNDRTGVGCRRHFAQKQAIQRLQAEETLLRDLLELQDRERRMVAYEIHDGFIQDIVGARMVLQGDAVDREHVDPGVPQAV